MTRGLSYHAVHRSTCPLPARRHADGRGARRSGGRIWAAFVLLCLASATACGPLCAAATVHSGPDHPPAISDYLYRSWDVNAGLPQNSVTSIAQTPEGYLWIGTDEGLARYDGHTFTVFDRTNTPALRRGSAVRVLLADSRGRLWIGTREGGLISYQNGRFTEQPSSQGVAGLFVNALLEDRAGQLWVGTLDAGLYRETPSGFAAFREGGLDADARITSLALDPQGTIWAGTTHGLFVLREEGLGHFTVQDGLYSDVVHDLEFDSRGRLWIATRNGVNTIEHGRVGGAADPELARMATLKISLDREGHLWFGTDGAGVARLANGHLEFFGTKDGLAHDRVQQLFFDHEGSVWVGTEGGGLCQLRRGTFTMLTSRDGLSHTMALTVFEDSQGALWVGTEGGGVSLFTEDGVQTLDRSSGLASDVILAVQEDARGDIWIGTYGGGLLRRSGRRIERFDAASGFLSDNIFALHRSPSGVLWIGTDAGVARYENGHFTTLTTKDGLSTNTVSFLLEDRERRLWIGTPYAGLNLLSGGVISHFGTDEGLASETISAVHEDAEGGLWVGTYGGGLCRLLDRRFSCISTQHGLPSENILQLLEDDEGYLWMGSNKGIFRTRIVELEAVARGTQASVLPELYNHQDGLSSSEMNGGTQPSAWKGADGSLWFASIAGVARVDPGDLRRNTAAPRVVIQSIAVDGMPMDLREGLILEPGRKKVEFSFAALTYVAQERVVYRYRLDGYDEGWTEAGAQRTATYTNLDPGRYTFRVMARNGDGVWSEQQAVVTLRLKPHFYQTLWFWTSALLGLVLLGLAGYRLRIRHLKRRQRELEALVETRTCDLRAAKDQIEEQAERLRELDRFKTRFFANISHEFRTPLTLMVGPLESALSGSYGPASETMQRQLALMLRNALRLLRLVNQLLDLSKLESGKMELRARCRNVVPFLETIVASFATFADGKRIDLRFVATEDEIPLYYEADKLEKIFFNLLSNALKFTPKEGSVTLSAEAHGPDHDVAMPAGALVVRVRDTGPGIPPEQLPLVFDRFHQVEGAESPAHEGTGIGLALVRELVLLHGGRVDVASQVGEGTEFTVTLPLGAAHLDPAQIADDADEDDEEVAAARLVRAMTAHQLPASEGDLGEVPAGAHEIAPADETAPLVLVVDDNQDIRDYVSLCLHGHFRVQTAADGLEGLEMTRTLLPDVVISDIMMPRLDGYGLVERIKGDASLRHIPVILLSAKTTQDTIISGLEHGADEYLPKPFNARELLVRLRNLLKIRAQEKELKTWNDALEAKVQEQLTIIMRERDAYERRILAEKERAEEAARLKSAILNNMSHEFRTPMTAILGYAEILMSEIEEDHKAFAEYIHKNGKRLMGTLTAVLDLSRLEAAAIQARSSRHDVEDVIREMVGEMAPQAQEKGLVLRYEAATEPVEAHFDRAALSRVLHIVLDNALKFTTEGEVTVRAERLADEARVTVRDTGIGISPSFLPHIFTPFEQESMGDSRSFEGSGLSLSVAKRLIDLTGGRIEVESTKGAGTVFTIALPTDAASLSYGDGSVVAAQTLAIES